MSLLILDPDASSRYMDVRGIASTEPDTDYAWAVAHINPKYDADVRSFDAPGATRGPTQAGVVSRLRLRLAFRRAF